MSYFRPDIERIEGYVPGEQPQETGWIKLNTNENPYPASPQVIAAIKQAAEGRLNVYPDPIVKTFCKKVADLFDVEPESVLPANGSDENLTILIRSFVDSNETISYPYPSYVLYETLTDIQGAHHERILLNEDWSWDFERTDSIVKKSKLVFVPNPNSPSGNRWSDEEICRLIPEKGILVLDEAYGDFADNPHQAELIKGEHSKQIIITRTLSKSYSLAGIRFGFALGDPDLIRGMKKVKDSYNCNTLSIAAAVAAIDDQDWMKTNVKRIQATRTRLVDGLHSLGFQTIPSQANFVWTTHPEKNHAELYEQLKQNKILIRYMKFPAAGPEGNLEIDGIRITVGTDQEIDGFLAILSKLMTN